MASAYDNNDDDDDDWGEGEALATEGTDIVSDAHRATTATRADDLLRKDDGDHSPTQSRAERLQAKIEREAALRSGRGSSALLAAPTASAVAPSVSSSPPSAPLETLLESSSSVSSQRQQRPPEAPEDRLAAKIRRETAASSTSAASAAGSGATRTTLATSSASHDSGGSTGAGTTTTATSETSDRIQARLREEQRRAREASYSYNAAGGSSQGRGGSAASSSASTTTRTGSVSVPGVTIHGPTPTTGGGSSSIGERASAKASTKCAAAHASGTTPDDRLRSKVVQQSSSVAAAMGLGSRGSGSGSGSFPPGAVAVRGPHADAYDAGIRPSRYSEYLSDGSDPSVAEDGFVGEDPSEPPVPSGEAQDGSKNDEARFCGMSKRMGAIVVGAAVLVIIIAAAAGGAAAAAAAAGGSNSSSPPGSDEGESNAAPTDLPTPSVGSAPTWLPTLPPTEFIPPECQLSMLPRGEDTNDQFGSSVAVSGDTAIVGAPLSSKNGSVHLYVRGDDFAWVKSAIVLEAPSGSCPVKGCAVLFGKALAIHGDTIAVGAVVPNPSDSEVGDRVGCIYVFIRGVDGSWKEETRLLSNDLSSSDSSFGSAVAIYENIIVVGEPKGESLPLNERTGSFYIFERRAGERWVQTAKLRPDDGNIGDNFGNDVDVSGSTVVIGAGRNDANGKDSGAAYVYSRDNDTWALKSKLVPADGSAFDSFGRSVAISGDIIVVGARGDDDNGSSSGSTYVFVDNNGQWVEAAKLLAEDGEASDAFGKAVDVDGDFIVIGAEGADDDRNLALDNIGAVYVFERVGFSVWTQIRQLQPPGGDKDDAFGSSVATYDGTVVIGSYTSTSVIGNIETGRAHIIEMC